ncbi:hypothetical protein RKD30_004044 [Streptomyces pristinaespiralis]
MTHPGTLVLIMAVAVLAPLLAYRVGRWIRVPLVIFEVAIGIAIGHGPGRGAGRRRHALRPRPGRRRPCGCGGRTARRAGPEPGPPGVRRRTRRRGEPASWSRSVRGDRAQLGHRLRGAGLVRAGPAGLMPLPGPGTARCPCGLRQGRASTPGAERQAQGRASGVRRQASGAGFGRRRQAPGAGRRVGRRRRARPCRAAGLMPLPVPGTARCPCSLRQASAPGVGVRRRASGAGVRRG